MARTASHVRPTHFTTRGVSDVQTADDCTRCHRFPGRSGNRVEPDCSARRGQELGRGNQGQGRSDRRGGGRPALSVAQCRRKLGRLSVGNRGALCQVARRQGGVGADDLHRHGRSSGIRQVRRGRRPSARDGRPAKGDRLHRPALLLRHDGVRQSGQRSQVQDDRRTGRFRPSRSP
jgi:hypothetical protein